jgi:multiple sugar transport system substrate-binding protein
MRYMLRTLVGMLAISLFVAGCAGPASPTAPTAVAPTAAPAAVTTITEWDNQASVSVKWQQLLNECTPSTGITIERQDIPRNDLMTKVMLAAPQHQLPGVLLLDNPNLQQVADTGALAPLTDYGVDTSGLFSNLTDAGSWKGKVYGIAPGINGLALIYNKDMFAKAGLQPPTTWAEIESAAAALTKGDVYGIAFSAPATEEGSWQFEPWLWGAGGDLSKLDSPEATKALQFWADLVQKGYASKSVVQWAQGDVNNQFMAGKAAMQENGNWNLNSLEQSKINFGIVAIPKPDGGTAPGPMGGEVLTIPLNSNPAVMQAAGKVVNCLLSDKMMLEWADLQAYIPSRVALAQQAANKDPNLQSFLQAAPAERTRTGPPANLGPNYTNVSQPLWTAIQSALTGKMNAQQSLTQAQQEATKAMGK